MRRIVDCSVVCAVIVLAWPLAGTRAEAQSYPLRPVTVVIPFAAGSASDVVSRIMLDKMSKSMGQPFIADNRPGAGGNTGTAAVTRATPDGYTLLGAGSGPVAANMTLYSNLGYDPERDLEVISPFAAFTIVVVASSQLPVSSLSELIGYAKANPGKSQFRIGGNRQFAALGRRVFRPGHQTSGNTHLT
jgi:tripartite-type tricarboxylate transporter receptor subunit TctC